MATGWNSSQASYYLEGSSDAGLVVYKDPHSTEWIKPTSIAFFSLRKGLLNWTDPRAISSPNFWGTLSCVVCNVWEGMSAPGAQLIVRCNKKKITWGLQCGRSSFSQLHIAVFKTRKTSFQSRLLQSWVFPVSKTTRRHLFSEEETLILST